jgi:hypothetical protein
MKKKRFALAASELKQIAPNRGSCIASDRITVAGQVVGFMYRDLPDNDIDSGWHFFSGEETQEYADDPANFAIYNVNTIANYDPDIVEHLDAPAFSAFERDPVTRKFVAVGFPG